MEFTLSVKAKVFLSLAVFLFVFTLALTVWRIVQFFAVEDQSEADIIMGFVLLVNLCNGPPLLMLWKPWIP